MEVGGIDPDIFVTNRNMLSEDFMCAICHYILRNAVTCPKGHQFCRSCIETWLRTNRTCPYDRAALTTDQLNAATIADRTINKSHVACNNPDEYSAEHCDWIGPYGSRAVHDRCCIYRKEQCDSCKAQLERRHLMAHVCPKEEVTCGTCNVTLKRDNMDMHTQFLCSRVTVACPLQCGANVFRQDVVHHIIHACRSKLEACSIPGCGEIVQDMAAHHEDNGRAHTYMMLQGLTQGVRPIQVNSGLTAFTWTVRDITRTSQSPEMVTQNHRWALLTLPSNRDTRRHLGVFVKMLGGHPTVVNLAVRLYYGSATASRCGQTFISANDVKGWQKALLDTTADEQGDALDLKIDVVIQALV